MPSDDSDFAQSSSQHNHVDDSGRLMRGTEEIDLMEPAPHKLNLGDEWRGYLKEKWGRLVNDEQMVKEGLAIEKAAHPDRDRARAEERLDKFLEAYNLGSARRVMDRRHTT